MPDESDIPADTCSDQWLRISNGCAYFSLKHRGISDRETNPAQHWHALIHIPGMERRKLFFAIRQNESIALVRFLKQGHPGEEYHTELLAGRGHITILIHADGERTLVFDILPGGNRAGAKGTIQGGFRNDPLKVRGSSQQSSSDSHNSQPAEPE